MTETISIRRYESGDYPAVEEITRCAFAPVALDAKIEAALGPLNGPCWWERKCADIVTEMTAEPGGGFVAIAGDRVVGYVTTEINLPTSVGRIPNLAVDPRWHGCGAGKALLRRALAYFRELNLQTYRLETTVDNETGQALYPRFGFQEMTRLIIYAMSADQATALALDADPATDGKQA